MKNSILNELQDHHTNSQRQRYQLPDESETEPCQRMIDETLQKQGDTTHFCEYLKKEQVQQSSLIHQEEAPSSCIRRRGEEPNNKPSSHGVNQMGQGHHANNAVRSPDGTLPKSIDVTRTSKRWHHDAAADDLKGSILLVFDHLSGGEHRTKLTLLGALQEAAAIVVPMKDQPANESSSSSSKGNELESAEDHGTRGRNDDPIQGNEKRGRIYDYLAEHRARMDRLNALQLHKEQSNMGNPSNEWDDDDDLDSRQYYDDDEYNGIDELIFEIEL